MIREDPLQPQDLVVTMLGAYVRPFARTVWSGGMVALLGEFGFSDGAARAALTRLVRRDLIARVRSGRLVHYHLTPRCERLLVEGDGRIFTLGRLPADAGPWTVLWHQIPEDRRLERSRLARRLRFLGFGSVQDSVWVSPHDHSAEVAELLEDLGVAGFAAVFVATMREGPGWAALVGRAWNLSGLEERYEAFGSEFSRYLSPDSSLSDRHAFEIRTRMTHVFRAFAQLDPELPDELAPLSKPRSRAANIFEALYTGLAAASQRHFDAVTTTSSEPPPQRTLKQP
ncbi:MAG TPA: PaaX family transcriptional regulator C-terminal domain-containing protein [Solirubrobacteraceae bacterium]|nr:PaaX family transcriptional regulator C-terminal domain-containing protein [Solirubrobacteraceae bacterium]